MRVRVASDLVGTRCTEQICRPIYNVDKTRLEYTFPLGMHVLEEAVGTQKSLFMKFMLRLRTGDNSRMFRSISTRSVIRREDFLEQCQVPVRLDVNLAQLLKFDVLQGLLDSTSDNTSTTSMYASDKAGSPQSATIMQQQSLTIPLTFVFRLDQTASTASTAYEVDLVTIFTMYFISNVKKNSVLHLLNSGAGFSQSADGSLIPDDTLLRLCPLQRIQGVYGCVARFEIQNSLYEFEQTAGFPIAVDPDLCTSTAGTWAEHQRLPSRGFVQSISAHADSVRQRFDIDGASRKSYVISHDIPWSEAEFRNNRAISHLQYPQHSISMFAFKLGLTGPALPLPRDKSVMLAVSMQISADLAFFSEHTVQNRAQICGIMAAVTGVDIGNIEILPGETNVTRGMVEFMLVLRFPWARSPFQTLHVRRLSAHFSSPQTKIRLRVQAMFDAVMQTWTLYRTNSSLHIVQAIANFPDDMPGRRLLSTMEQTASRAIPASVSAQGNQTTKFFVRSYDAVENSDNMLDFWSTDGQFSRMLVFTLRYSLSTYCVIEELQTLQDIEHLLGPAIRLASNQTVTRIKVTAFAPNGAVQCPSPQTGTSINNTLNTVRATIRLDVEIILFYSTVGIFHIFASNALRKAGVDRIVLIWTKQTTSSVDIALDTLGFRIDGSMIDTEQILGDTGSDAGISGPALICIYVGGVVVAIALTLVVYRLLASAPLHPQTPTLLQPYMPLHVIRSGDCGVLSHDRPLFMCCNFDSRGMAVSC